MCWSFDGAFKQAKFQLTCGAPHTVWKQAIQPKKWREKSDNGNLLTRCGKKQTLPASYTIAFTNGSRSLVNILFMFLLPC